MAFGLAGVCPFFLRVVGDPHPVQPLPHVGRGKPCLALPRQRQRRRQDLEIPARRGLSSYGPQTFELKQSRRMRDDKVYYFDHPQFGVIARVTELKPDAAN